MTIRTKLAVCSSRMITDTQDNRISLIDVFEEIASPSFPVIVPRMTFLWMLEKDAADVNNQFLGHISLEIGGQVITSFDVDVNFQNVNRTRAVAVLGGLPIAATGIMRVRFSGEGLPEALYEIEVKSIVGGNAIAAQTPITNPTPPVTMLS